MVAPHAPVDRFTLPFDPAPTGPDDAPTAFLLHRGPYPDRPEVWSLDLTDGETDSPSLFADASLEGGSLSDRLATELDFRRDHPRLVLVGRESDPFSSDPDAQQQMVRVVEVLAKRGIVAWLSTRRIPTSEVLEFLTQRRELVRVTVS